MPQPSACPRPLHLNAVARIIGELDRGGEVAFVGLGDSLTYGWMVERGFFDRFVDKLAAHYRSARISRRNAGVPGDTAREGALRLERIPLERNTVVIVQFGLNDVFQGVSATAFLAVLERIIDVTVRASAAPVLATSCPVCFDREPSPMDEFYGAIRELASLRQVALADVDAYWRRTAADAGQGLYQEDGVHPTDKGHALMADCLCDLFKAR